MIKLLSILGALGLTASAPAGAVACGVQQTKSPVASHVDENGILTSDFKMKLKKDSISFDPLNKITLPDDSVIAIEGLVLINSDIDSEIRPNDKISKAIPAKFSVKYKDIKNYLNNTRNKLTKDVNTYVHLTADVLHLESELGPRTVVMNISDVYANKISGHPVAMVVDLPRYTAMPTPIIPEPIPEPIVPVPDYPLPVPDKPDHYIPGIIPCTNADLGIVDATMNDSGSIITVKLTGFPKTQINKSQIVLTDSDGNRIKVFFVQSSLDDNEVDIVLDTPISKDKKLMVAILGIGAEDGLTNCVPVDMSHVRYTPSGWLQWESIWSLTKQACYYGYKTTVITFKLSVQLAWLLCPCQWPAVVTMTACDVLWAIR